MQNNEYVELEIIIPVYNEAEIIGHVAASWYNKLKSLDIKSFRITCLNDGSKDATLVALTEANKTIQELNIIDKKNSGHGPTILMGYRIANAKWIFQVDSDNEMEAEHFHFIWNERNNYDFVIGRRFNRVSPLPRRIISAVSRLTIRLFYGPGIFDVNSPYRLYLKEKFSDIFNLINDDTFAPNVILSGVAIKKNFRIKEIEVPTQFRQTGEVSIKKLKLLKAAAKSLVQTISARFTLKWQ